VEVISSFTGKYRFLSNFFPCLVVSIRGRVVESVEHAYQMAKTLDKREQTRIASRSSPAAAKAIGRRVQLRPDWDEIKLAVMMELLTQKFEEESPLAGRLLLTGNSILVEGNTWGDTYWGVCRGQGENWLGRLLMLRRSQLWL
jgi:hypothetical protein